MSLVVEVRVNEGPNLFIMSMQNVGPDQHINCIYTVIMWRHGKKEKEFTVKHKRADGAEVLIAKSMLAYKGIASD